METRSWEDLSIHEQALFCLLESTPFPKDFKHPDDLVVILSSHWDHDKDSEKPTNIELTAGNTNTGHIMKAVGINAIKELIRKLPATATARSYHTCTVPLTWGLEDKLIDQVYSLFPQNITWREMTENDIICTCEFKNVQVPKATR